MKKMALSAMAMGAVGVLGLPTHAATIGTWSQDFAYTGNAGSGTGGANPSVSGSGSTATWDRGSGNNAVIAPISPTTLAVGGTITLSGTLGFSSSTSFTDLGNEQLRFGLFNTQGNSGSTGWLGYMAEVPNNTSGVIQADTANGGNWGSGSGGTLLTTTNAGTGTKPSSAAGPYTFSLQITQTAVSSQSVLATFTSSDGTTYTWSASATDSSSAAAANATYNELGFFDGSTGMGTTPVVNFSNVTVTSGSAVPEPASLGLLAMGAAGLLLRKKTCRA